VVEGVLAGARDPFDCVAVLGVATDEVEPGRRPSLASDDLPFPQYAVWKWSIIALA
jgi:hypothetical protein